MSNILLSVGICFVGYLSGSLTFAIWITRLVKGIDVRDGGSGHAGTTNTVRQAGWVAGVFVLIFDLAKGFFPTWLAMNYAPYDWAIPVTGALAVAGHCWPLFARFRGGMGAATAGGVLIALGSLYFFVVLAVLIFLTLVLKHSARASMVTGVLLPLLLYLFGARGINVWVGLALAVVLFIRFTRDWNRQYRELWLDRELN